MSDHHSGSLESLPLSSGDLEDPLLSPPPSLHGPPPLPLSAYYPFFLLLMGAVLSVIATVAVILNAQSVYEVNVFHLTSFTLVKNSSLATWEAKLSDDPYVARDARSWLYSRSGFVSVSSAGWGGADLVLRSSFTMRDADEEAVVRDGVLILDLLIEANATRGTVSSGTASYLMVECSDLEIEFADDRSFGALSGGGKRCGGQVYATKSDALKGSRILDLMWRIFYYLTFRRDRGEARVARRRT